MKNLFYAVCINVLLAVPLFSQVNAQKLNDLDFEDVYSGYSSEVLATDASAAKFRIQNKNLLSTIAVSFSFSLPAYLTSGKDKIPVTFNAQHASYSFNGGAPSNSFDPHSSYYTQLGLFSLRFYLDLWLGGVVSVPENAPAGNYNGTIVLDVEII